MPNLPTHTGRWKTTSLGRAGTKKGAMPAGRGDEGFAGSIPERLLGSLRVNGVFYCMRDLLDYPQYIQLDRSSVLKEKKE